MSELILGYDAGCSMCARVGHRVREEAGGRLRVIPLQSTEMLRYREQVFGEDAPWQPTLIRKDGPDAKGWCGWRMGPALSAELGLAKAARILSFIGDEVLPRPSRWSRRRFIRGTASLAAGGFFLAGFPISSSASVKKSGNVRKVAEFGAGEIPKRHLDLVNGEDLKNVVGGSALRDLKNLAISPVKRSSGGMSRGQEGELPRTFVAQSHELDGGVLVDSVAFGDEGRQVVHYAEARYSDGRLLESSATTYTIDRERNAIRALSVSVNGAEPSRLAGPDLERGILAGADPCGGCTGSGGPGDRSKKSSRRCVEDIDLACALGLAGCGGCFFPCSSANVPGCLWCLMASCGSIIAAGGCCKDSGETVHTCVRCTSTL